ncbi:MAG: LysR family transcriptional regulator [Burkholderiales bacterium]
MTAFVRAVERAGFSAAARDLGLTPSAISKLVARLETHLGVALLHRTTRRLTLTPEGEVYFARAQSIVEAIADAEEEVMHLGHGPRGRLRINVGTAFGTYVLVPALPAFKSRFPGLTLELSLEDRVVDLVAAGADLAVRLAPLADEGLVARKLTTLNRIVCASPAYLERHGVPRTADDLGQHDCLAIRSVTGQREWPFNDGAGLRQVTVRGTIDVNNAQTLYELGLMGLGIIRLADIIVGPAIHDGRLVPLLVEEHCPEELPLYAVYPATRHRPRKVGAMVDFLQALCVDPPWRITPAMLRERAAGPPKASPARRRRARA